MKPNDCITFLGWEDTYAKFKIRRAILPNERVLDRIIVAHEGHWAQKYVSNYEKREIYEGGRKSVTYFEKRELYEDIQKDLGYGLTFRNKEYSEVLNRSLFSYDWNDNVKEAILAVYATGEELCFEIYGCATEVGGMCLLLEREL